MGKFEEHWKEVFVGAEILPADSVWINIDRDLANDEGATMKKRMVLYQRIAAVSVLFTLLMGSFGIYRWKETKSQTAQYKASENKLRAPENEKKITDEENRTASATEELNAMSKEQESRQRMASTKSKANVILSQSKNNTEVSNPAKTKGFDADKKISRQDPETTMGLAQEESGNGKVNPNPKEKKFFGTFEVVGNLALLPVPEIHEGPVQAEIFRRLPAISGAFLARKEKKTTHEQVWASVTAAAGSYNPNTNSYSSYNYAALQSSSASNTSSVVGTSYSFGMLGGMRVTNRVVVQSGVQYVNQAIGSVSNINASGALTQFASNSPSINYSTTTPYNITSENEFVSVPVQAGYLFIDRKMGLQLNSGVSTDFFIRNTLSDPSGQRQSYSQSAGQDSPYRSVTFSGLLNSEVSYKLSNRYRVAVVPGFRYSFSPVLKSSSGSSGNPFVWDVGFRFRYIFK